MRLINTFWIVTCLFWISFSSVSFSKGEKRYEVEMEGMKELPEITRNGQITRKGNFRAGQAGSSAAAASLA